MPSDTSRPPGWTPVRKGRRFCSPACGGGCSRVAYDNAHRRARYAALYLGRGWRPEVWENLGWHYRVVDASGFLKIYPADRSRWTAFLGDGPDGGNWSASAGTPRAAIAAVRAKLRADLAHLARLLRRTA